MSAFTVGELFAGIGGFSLAFDTAGFHTSWFVEKDVYCQAVLHKRFPAAAVYGDIYECRQLPYVDVITAGFPCQPFSLAGSRKGERDERYLVPEMLRVIAEVQPYVVLLENVPGFANIANGHTFKQLLRALAKIGFDAEWQRIRASDAGAPHIRERLLIVAWRRDVPDANGKRLTEQAAEQNARADEERDVPPSERGGRTVVYALESGSEDAPDTNDRRRAQPHAHQRRVSVADTRHSAAGERAIPQSRLGRSADGLPYRVDRHQFPAGSGAAQYPHEPPHVAPLPHVASRKHARRARLQALGNAVVPQCVYPVALAIREWLEVNA